MGMRQNRLLPLELLISHFPKNAVGSFEKVIEGYRLAIESSYSGLEISNSERNLLLVEIEEIETSSEYADISKIVNYPTLLEQIKNHREKGFMEIDVYDVNSSNLLH